MPTAIKGSHDTPKSGQRLYRPGSKLSISEIRTRRVAHSAVTLVDFIQKSIFLNIMWLQYFATAPWRTLCYCNTVLLHRNARYVTVILC